MIDVVVNGERRSLEDGATIETLIDSLSCGRRGVAVAVNAEIVARSAWAATRLAADDTIEILQAVQGG
jgi:sulfur carrier protein